VGDGLSRRELGKAAIAGVALAGLGGIGGALAGCGSDPGPEGRQSVIDRLPGLGIPRPVDFIRTSWARDPLALCSYSYLAPTRFGSGIRSMLAEPVGRIAFAGEATARIPATVHGAIQAGQTAARLSIGELDPGARVAVVGAGAAGLSCAGELKKLGFEPVLLEASDRVGGRVRSGDLDGTPVELGASWIHGVKGNPLTGLARESGVGLHPYDYDLAFPVAGQAELGQTGERRYWRAINSFEPGAPGADRQTVDWLLPWRWGPGLEWAVEVETAQEYGADPDQLAALATWEGDWLGGGDALLDAPYVKVIEKLSGEAETIFGFEVRRVTQDSNGVVIRAGSGEEVSAEAAVITVPIGVLKSGRIDFQPSLPAHTRTAIDGLGAGLLDKLWLAFDEPFWDEDSEGFQWIDPRRPGRWGFWVNALPETGKPMLMTLSGGSDAHRLEGKTDLEVVSGALRALDAMFGSAT